MGCYWHSVVEAGDAMNILQHRADAHNKGLSGQNVNSAEVETLDCVVPEAPAPSSNTWGIGDIPQLGTPGYPAGSLALECCCSLEGREAIQSPPADTCLLLAQGPHAHMLSSMVWHLWRLMGWCLGERNTKPPFPGSCFHP